MGAVADVATDQAADIVGGQPGVALEQIQVGGNAFEFQAFVDDVGIKAVLEAIADSDRHQASPPGVQAGQLIRKNRIVIVDSFHT
ncbi:hypothetical protein D3C77_701760 [compost metagenome]